MRLLLLAAFSALSVTCYDGIMSTSTAFACSGITPESALLNLERKVVFVPPSGKQLPDTLAMPYVKRPFWKLNDIYSHEDLECWSKRGDKVAAFLMAAWSLNRNSVPAMVSALPGSNAALTYNYMSIASGFIGCAASNCTIAQKACLSGLPEAQYIQSVMMIDGFGRKPDKSLADFILSCSVEKNYILAIEFQSRVNYPGWRPK